MVPKFKTFSNNLIFESIASDEVISAEIPMVLEKAKIQSR